MRARELLESFGIPVIPTRLCNSEEDAVQAAEELGYPVAVKADVAHKTDAGAVRLGCAAPAAVRDAYQSIAYEHSVLVQPMAGGGVETILGLKRDPLVGPALVFGLGGIFAEVLRDVSLRIPPVDLCEAERMLDELRGTALLHGARGGPPADVPALVQAIANMGELALALGDRLVAVDVNPLIVLPQGVIAVDALVELS
jgi:succinyl-CoA synthetase beta subunit